MPEGKKSLFISMLRISKTIVIWMWVSLGFFGGEVVGVGGIIVLLVWGFFLFSLSTIKRAS